MSYSEQTSWYIGFPEPEPNSNTIQPNGFKQGTGGPKNGCWYIGHELRSTIPAPASETIGVLSVAAIVTSKT